MNFKQRVPYIGNKRDILYFPKNFALLRILDKKRKEFSLAADSMNTKIFNNNFTIKSDLAQFNKPSPSVPFEGVDFCKEHGKKLEIVCLEHQQRICVNCALFGSHKNHNIKGEEEVLREISFRADKVLEIFQAIEENSSEIFKQNFNEDTLATIYENFIKKTERISKAINEKFSVFF